VSVEITQGDLSDSAQTEVCKAVVTREKKQMTKIRQKSDGRIVAKGLGNKVRTSRDERATGAKASMVNEETAQLTLRFVAAEKTKRLVANGGAVSGKSVQLRT
jgi:hypothetical protein